MRRNAKRIRPRPEPRSRVKSERDVEVLRSLGWAGYLATPQLTRLHFPSIRVAQRRLRALLDHGLIRAHLQGEALHRPNVFTLAPAGAARLESDGGSDIRLGRVLRVQKLAHGLAIREVFVAFILAERSGAFRLQDFRFDSDLTAEPVFKAAHLVPDGLAIVERGGVRDVVACEVDLGSETTATLRAKFSAWCSVLNGSALRNAVLLFLAPTESRRRTLVRLAEEAECPTHVVLLDSLAAPGAADLFARVVRTERIALKQEPP